MPKFIDLTGRHFGYWKVIKRCGNTKGGKPTWLCECKCGTNKIIRGDILKNGGSKSCGCMTKKLQDEKRVTHGKTGTRLYKIWNQMIQRTTNSKVRDYKYYGGRGITICKDWKESFEVFHKWANENGYAENLTIDRIDNSKGYQPDNCRWTTRKEQSNNTRYNHYLTYHGKTKTITDWAKDTGIKRCVLYERINKLGWDAQKALTTEVKTKKQ